MTTLTLRFKGVHEQILDLMVNTGFAESKSEAIRMALLSMAQEMHLIDDKVIMDFLRKEAAKSPMLPEEILAAVERAKHEAINR